MEKLRSYANSISISFESWIISFAGIVLVRVFFEQFSSFKTGEFMLINLPAIIHLCTFFLASVVMLMVILMFFAKTTLKEVSTICLLGFLIIWLAPIIDLAIGGVGGNSMGYLFLPAKELLIRFLTFFGGDTTSGATLGIQIEAILGIIFCYTYVYAVTKNIARSIGASVVFYCAMFFLGSIPSIIGLLSASELGVTDLIVSQITQSNIIQNNLDPNFIANNGGLLGLGFDKLMIGINTIIAILASVFLFFIGMRKKFIALMKNCRPERIFYFFLLFTFGVAFARTPWFVSWIDVQSCILALIAFFCAAIFSICQNDIHDEKIDIISNPNRPFASKALSRSDMETASRIFLIFAFLSAYASSLYTLFFTCFIIFIYFLYSNPPFRLKRFVIVNSSLVSLACLSAVLEGFFLASPDKSIVAFPFGLALAIVVFHTVVSNIRDIKDFEGDRADGIKTLPVLLGLKKSKYLIAGAICFFYILIPWYFDISFLLIPSIIVSLLSWYFITQENYKEWKGFAVYMIYLILIIGSIIFK